MSHGAPLPMAAEQQEPVGNYFTITYKELFKAHVLDVHLPNLLIGVSASVEVPLITILGRRIGATYSEIADYISVSALCRTLLDIPIGIIVEYVGVRNVMFLCLAMNVVASVVGFTISNSTELFAFCMLSGISLGGFFLSRHIFVAGISSKKYRGLLMAILSGLLRWAHVIGPVASGLFATYLGDVRYSFIVSAAASAMAFGTLAIATWSTRYQQVCEHSCTASVVSSSLPPTPRLLSEDDAADETRHSPQYHHHVPAAIEPSSGAHSDAYAATPLLPPTSAAAGAAASPVAHQRRRRSGSSANGTDPTLPADRLDSRVIVGAETPAWLLPPAAPVHGACAPVTSSFGAASTTAATLHPRMGAKHDHYFHLSTLWTTFVDYWSVIWRLGLYIVLATALRANRKLLISFAGMRSSMTDAQVSYLLGFSFIFDAILFPLGGLVMDLLGRQFAMVPVAVGLGTVFFFLPFCSREVHLYMAASAFGIVDALGCGLIMTLTADRAPPRYGAPFFGIMRTVQDMGHVVGARGTSYLMKHAGFNACCWTLTFCGFFTAAWGVYGVPRDSDTLTDAPHLVHAALVAHTKDPHKQSSHSQSSDEVAPLMQPTPASVGSASYGTATATAVPPRRTPA